MKRIRTTLMLLAAAVAVVAIGASASASSAASSEGEKNIVETAVSAGQFKTLASLLTAAGLAEKLQGTGPFTVFAPTDAAFAKVPAAALDKLGQDRAKLRSVLLYHVVKGKVTAAQAMKIASAQTLNRQAVEIGVTDGKVYVGGAQVTSPDVAASNGVIHVVDKVLLPQNILPYYTYKVDVPLGENQILRFTPGKGYWAG